MMQVVEPACRAQQEPVFGASSLQFLALPKVVILQQRQGA